MALAHKGFLSCQPQFYTLPATFSLKEKHHFKIFEVENFEASYVCFIFIVMGKFYELNSIRNAWKSESCLY